MSRYWIHPNRMFDPIVRDQRNALQREQDDQAERERRAAEAEARLNEPLTRREMIEAIEAVAAGFGPEHVAIRNAFDALALVLS